MHGSSQSPIGGGKATGYNLRSSRNVSGAGFGCSANKENGNAWNFDDRRGTKRRSKEECTHVDNQVAQAKIVAAISQVAQNQGVMASG